MLIGAAVLLRVLRALRDLGEIDLVSASTGLHPEDPNRPISKRFFRIGNR
jgi:hypothetical protein